MTFDNAVVPDTFLRPVARPKGRFQELTPAVSLSKEPVSFISSCTFLSLSIVSLSMFSGISRPRFRQTLRPSVFVRRKNFAKVRRKFVTSKFFFNFFCSLFSSPAVSPPQQHSAAAPSPPAGRKLACFPKASAKVCTFYLPTKYFYNFFSEKFRQNILKNPQNPRQPTATHPITSHQKKFTLQHDFHTPQCTTNPKHQRIHAPPPLNPHSTHSYKQQICS